MALHINTDEAFDEALEWLARRLAKNKSELVRYLVLERARSLKRGFQFGALSGCVPDSSVDDVVDELKEFDEAV